MKNFLLLIFVSSLCFCHTIYIDTSISNDAKVNANSYELESATRIGYNANVWNNKKKLAIAIGLDFALGPIAFKDNNVELNVYSLYVMSKYSVLKKFEWWCSLGQSFAESKQIDDNNTILKDGPVYGLGFTYKINKRIGIHLGNFTDNYSIESTFLEQAHSKVEKNNFKVTRNSIQLAFTF